jgi:hypothetical protein
MNHFVTGFDINFAPQGISLWLSMERNIKNYTLWIICFDTDLHQLLKKENLVNVRLLKMEDLETEELIEVKKNRSKVEYYWTLSPFIADFVFDRDKTLNILTYIDADLWFKEDPKNIIDDFINSNQAILLTDHAYEYINDNSHKYGKYCVQFIVYDRSKSINIRKWWQKKCIEWCYARVENGKFGDQKYLEELPRLFGDQVHILKNKELILGPWNVFRFPHGNLIAYHFHGLRLIDGSKVRIGEYPIPVNVIENIYYPYLIDFKNAINIIVKNNGYLRSQSKKMSIIYWIYINLKITYIKLRSNIVRRHLQWK